MLTEDHIVDGHLENEQTPSQSRPRSQLPSRQPSQPRHQVSLLTQQSNQACSGRPTEQACGTGSRNAVFWRSAPHVPLPVQNATDGGPLSIPGSKDSAAAQPTPPSRQNDHSRRFRSNDRTRGGTTTPRGSSDHITHPEVGRMTTCGGSESTSNGDGEAPLRGVGPSLNGAALGGERTAVEHTQKIVSALTLPSRGHQRLYRRSC